jgi:hypothetical protein
MAMVMPAVMIDAIAIIVMLSIFPPWVIVINFMHQARVRF